MRILFLNYEYPPLGGGAGNATQQFLREYAKQEGVEVDLVTSSIDNEYHLDHIGDSVRVHKLPIGKTPGTLRYQSQKELLMYSWKALLFSKKLLEKNSYEVIHAFFGIPCGFMAYLLSGKYNVPYIVSLRGSDVPGYSDRFKWIYTFLTPLIRFVWRHAARVVSNSKGLKELALSSDPSREIDVIYNGVDTEKFTPADQERSGDDVIVLCASRLMKRKGFIYVVEALSKLSEKYPQLQLVLAGGDGDASSELRAKVRDLDLERRVEFYGQFYNDELPAIQHKSDIFVFPSFNEGMSNSLLEAMAGGLPILMTPTGGAQELVSDGENGYIVEFANSDDIAQKLTILLEDKDLRMRMGRKSRSIAEEMNWSNVAQEYIDMYRHVKEGR